MLTQIHSNIHQEIGRIFIHENSVSTVKNSYYRLARIHHPDKSSETDKEMAAERFNIIYQAYAILSNTESKKKYDDEGSNILFVRATVAAEWENYLKVVTDEDITNASNSYKGSAKERADILKAFIDGNGSIIHIMNNVPFTRRDDEPRIMEIIQNAIKNQELLNIKIKKLPKRN